MWFKKPKGVTYVVPTSKEVNKDALKAVRIRQGMWVVPKDMTVGVVLDADMDGVVRVMLAKEDGTNLVEVQVHYTNLRQAYYKEIPGPRRPLDQAKAESWGYV